MSPYYSIFSGFGVMDLPTLCTAFLCAVPLALPLLATFVSKII